MFQGDRDSRCSPTLASVLASSARTLIIATWRFETSATHAQSLPPLTSLTRLGGYRSIRSTALARRSEIPVAIDLWGRSSDSARTIFEVKTLRPGSELERVRAAISQLLEYRFFFAAPEDGLSLVSDHPLSDKRVRLLRALGIPVLLVEGDHMLGGSPDARERFPSLLDAEPRGSAGTRSTNLPHRRSPTRVGCAATPPRPGHP